MSRTTRGSGWWYPCMKGSRTGRADSGRWDESKSRANKGNRDSSKDVDSVYRTQRVRAGRYSEEAIILDSDASSQGVCLV